MLIVHHGLFWGGLEPVVGASYRKLSLCLQNDLAVYSVHLPLDEHPTLGNNALLCDAIGLPGERTPFMTSGFQVGASIDRAELLERVAQAVGGPVHLAPGGPSTTRRIGVVTGGAGSAVAKAAAEGVDTFITGEGPHHTYTLAEELGINLIYAGHYATETFGVKALGWLLKEQYGLPWSFIDHPTGL
jgi:dinuclear metal center YbgI/SA1388 family protein